jgi:hypothetical protein
MSRRSARRAGTDAQLDGLYGRVPVIECKGACRTTCTVIDMSDRERERIAERGVTIEPLTTRPLLVDPKPCAALGPLGQCTVYDVRPMICRIWGVTEDIPCVYGCVPTGDYLTTADALELIGESYLVGGPPRGLEGISGAAMRAGLSDPGMAAGIGAVLARGHAGDRRKASRP